MHVIKINTKPTPKMSVNIYVNQHLQLQNFVVRLRNNICNKKSVQVANTIF